MHIDRVDREGDRLEIHLKSMIDCDSKKDKLIIYDSLNRMGNNFIINFPRPVWTSPNGNNFYIIRDFAELDTRPFLLCKYLDTNKCDTCMHRLEMISGMDCIYPEEVMEGNDFYKPLHVL